MLWYERFLDFVGIQRKVRPDYVISIWYRNVGRPVVFRPRMNRGENPAEHKQMSGPQEEQTSFLRRDRSMARGKYHEAEQELDAE